MMIKSTRKRLTNRSLSTTSENDKSSKCCFRNMANCFRSHNIIDVDNTSYQLEGKKATNGELIPGNTENTNVNTNDKGNLLKPDNPEVVDDAAGRNTPKSENVIKSAMLIQRWYRRYQSRIEMRKLTAWNIYQSIEYSGEQDQLKLYEFFLTLIKNSAIINTDNTEVINQLNNNRKQSTYSDSSSNTDSVLLLDGEISNTKLINKVFESDRDETASKNPITSNFMNTIKKKSNHDIVIEPTYKGIELTFPIRKQAFHDLVNSFKVHKTLHAKYVIMILEETIKAYKKIKNINSISTNGAKHITVVGDLHGQLDDLLMIFYKNGLPSEDNPYLFNGDFVDRGPKSIEVSLTIFCGFLMSPNAVYINRGNHEDHVMNVRYGFLKEICNKYSNHSKRISYLYNEVFSWLPLSSLIDNKIYVVHGGISDRTLLKDILKIKREKYVSILKPPILNDNGELIENLNTAELFEWRQVLDALWSDPKQSEGVQANSFRGGGCCFGPDITKRIMEKNNLSLIIRSHECKEAGYEYTHNDKVLTVFSASNYYEYGSNNGSYVKISANVKPIIIQYHIKQGKEVTKNLTIRERVNAIESSAIQHLLEKFISNKMRLIQEFKLKDKDNLGAISLSDWCTTCGAVLDLKLPWRILSSRLAKKDTTGAIIYESTFEGLSISLKDNLNDDNISEALYRHKNILESIFRAIDKDHSGQISREEFRDCCRLINHHDVSAQFSDQSIDDMANTMDLNKDGHINLNEFLEAFRIVSNKF